MMELSVDIRYLNRGEIDIHQWDHCILNASNGLIYARSVYLDTMAKNWSSLVLNDYEAVMPLTWNRKYGIAYLYQPAFMAQLGVFSKTSLDKNKVENFIALAKSHFRFCEIHLNFGNGVFENWMRANYVLGLDRPYPEIRRGYKKRLIENLQESEQHELLYKSSLDYGSVIGLFKTEYGNRFPQVRPSDYQHFETLCGKFLETKMIFVRQVTGKTGELLNASIFFTDERRIYNIMSVTLQSGREKRAHFYLLDRLISEFSSKKLLLDFEGSEVPGIAEFYRKFGTVNQPYPFLKYNHLPFPFRFFK